MQTRQNSPRPRHTNLPCQSCQCWWNCYHYSFLSKPSKPVGWSTIFWCFKLWPGQCSLYSSGHINVTSQQDTRMSDLVFSSSFFKWKTKMPPVSMIPTQNPLRVMEILLAYSGQLFFQSTMLLLHRAAQSRPLWTAVWIPRTHKKLRGV